MDVSIPSTSKRKQYSAMTQIKPQDDYGFYKSRKIVSHTGESLVANALISTSYEPMTVTTPIDKNAVAKKEAAARVIQRWVTRYLDKKALLQHKDQLMIKEEGIGTAHDIIRKRSKEILNYFISKAGELSKEEKEIVKKIESLSIRFRHQTTIDLDDKRLCMLSKTLQTGKENSQKKGNSNLIFFSLEFSEKFTSNTPLRTQYDYCDFGPIAYFLDEKTVRDRPCFITLANMQDECISFRNMHSDITPPKHFGDWHAAYGSNLFFSPEDIRSAIALVLILDLRRNKKIDLKFVSQIMSMIHSDNF